MARRNNKPLKDITAQRPYPSLEVGPLLQAQLDAGNMWVEGDTYVGRCSDGVVIMLGSVRGCATVEEYLTKRPTPATW